MDGSLSLVEAPTIVNMGIAAQHVRITALGSDCQKHRSKRRVGRVAWRVPRSRIRLERAFVGGF
jgi:hypothetical protein